MTNDECIGYCLIAMKMTTGLSVNSGNKLIVNLYRLFDELSEYEAAGYYNKWISERYEKGK